VANVTKMLTERIALLAAELNNKAVKAAERRVAEVLRTAGEQREQAERELADAATTVDALEAMLDETKAEALTAKFVESQTHGQVQAVELAQLRERLTASEKHAAELEALRNLSTAELDRMRVELASVKATAESELRHASEEARNHKLATEQAHELLSHTREELSQARNQTAEAREEAARLRGQVEATEGRCTELMKVLAERPVAVDTGEKPATAANDTK
jgi:chromosome segregation ATPase